MPPYSLTSELGPVLAERMAHYSNAAEADALQKVKADLDHVRSIMLDNVDRVLERGERIDTLVSKADHLSFDAMNFRRATRRDADADASAWLGGGHENGRNGCDCPQDRGPAAPPDHAVAPNPLHHHPVRRRHLPPVPLAGPDLRVGLRPLLRGRRGRT